MGVRCAWSDSEHSAWRTAPRPRGAIHETGERIDIPVSNQPKFKAGKALKDAVN